MIAFADTLMRRIGKRLAVELSTRGTSLVLIAAAAFAASMHAADAKPRRERYVYAPPQAAMVVDGHTGKIIHASNADEPRYPASITKVMTLYLLFERLRDGRMSLETPLRISATAAAQPPSKLDLEPGKTILVKEAIYALVTKSANDCAVVVAENLAGSEAEFARQMTSKARAIGMSKTVFRNASGLPHAEQHTTARDLVTMGRRILADFPDYAKVFRTRFFAYGGENHRNHNGLLFSYEGTEGLKTGFTQASGFNLLTSARRENRHLMGVVLGGRSAVDRNARMRLLLNSGWARAADGSKLKLAPRAVEVAGHASKLKATAGAVEAASAVLDMPERNPAFHPTVSERTLQVAMAVMQDMERRTAQAEQQSAEAPSAADETAAAVATSQQSTEDEPPVLIAAVEETGPAPESGQEEGDTEANSATPNILGPYHIQVGSYASAAGAKGRLDVIAAKAKDALAGHGELTVEGSVDGKSRFRARFGQFTEAEAKTTCGKLKAFAIDCMVIRAQ